MNHRIRIPGSQGGREFLPADCPLALVAAGNGLGVERAAEARSPLLRLQWAHGALLAEPIPGLQATLNGAVLEAPARLHHGDILQTGGQQVLYSQQLDAISLESLGSDAQDAVEDQVIRPAEFKPGQASKKTWKDFIRPLPLAIAGTFLVLALLAWFLLTARSVEIVTEPPGAAVSVIEGGFNFQLGGRYLMRSGSYRLRLEMPGYQPLETELLVSGLQNQSHALVMQKLPGILSVTSDPFSGAQVSVDGQPVGNTPLLAHPVAAGKRTIRVEAPRYFPFQVELQVEGMEVAQSIVAQLAPRWAQVSVSSAPPGAELLVDGDPVGTTPLAAELLEGNHDLQLSLDGYKSWVQSLAVQAGVDVSLPTVQMARSDGLVKVRTTPPGASITVNGQFRGQSPVDLALAPGRSHELRASKAGYQPASRRVQVRSGEDQTVSMTLAAFLGEVRVLSMPGDATVYVDGREAGRSGESFSLPSVPHRIEIRKPGFAPHTATITPRPGFAQEIRAQLQTLEQARVAAIPRILTSSAGHELRLIQPGRFGMGTSRRERGRRANESLRQVEITRRYYIATREVTNDQFRQFSPKHDSGSFQGVSLNHDEYPVSSVSWEDAVEYCNWLSQRDGLPPAYEKTPQGWQLAEPLNRGYRLPTEAEWAWAARYQGGTGELTLPWGSSMPPLAGAGNFADITAKRILSLVLEDYNDGYATAAPAGKFTANALGLHDLGGNVAEWTHDYYQTYPGAVSDLFTDPMGPASGEMHVIRGSSWRHATLTELRMAYRDFDKEARPDLGFRVARFAE